MRRRDALAFLTVPAIAACGFRPVYGPSSGQATGPAQTGLAAISVALIPERAGQLLRLALQERFERGGVGVAHRYDLKVAFSVAAEGIAIQQDSSSSRTRMVGTASWWLVGQDAQRAALANGIARSVDGYNVLDQQYFAADLEGEVVQKRVAEAVADQIALQLALYFNKHAAASG